MDCPLSDATKNHGAPAFDAEGFRVLKVGKWTVYWIDASGTRCHNQAIPWVVPNISRIGTVTPNRGNIDALRSRVVASAENDAFQTWIGTRNVVDFLHCLDFLNQRFNTDWPL
jgi:hypothetical protein